MKKTTRCSVFHLRACPFLSTFCSFLLYSSCTTPILSIPTFGFYKLYRFFKIVSFFSIFFVPTLLIYFALDLTKNVAHTFIVLLYPLLVLGGVTILNVADLPLLAALSGFVLFVFYFLLGLSYSATERQRRAPRARRVVRPSPVTRAPSRCRHNDGRRTSALLFTDHERHNMCHRAVLKNSDERAGLNMGLLMDFCLGSIDFSIDMTMSRARQ